MRNAFIKRPADFVGISSSVLCIIHCLLWPVLLLSSSFSDGYHHGALLDYAFVLLAGGAVFFSARGLVNVYIRSGLWLSWLGFSISVLLHEVYPEALYVSLVFSVLLVLFHIASYRRKHT